MNEPSRQRRFKRSLWAVLAGLLVIVVLSTAVDMVLHATGVFAPPGQPMAAGLWVLAAGYRFVFGVLACYLAARLAPDRPMRHAFALGIVGLGLGLAGVIATWGRGDAFGPAWYGLVVMIMPLPCAWIGGRLAANAAR
jgi:hypothetical protein